MSHELNRVLAACADEVWAIDPLKAVAIANALALRHAGRPRDWSAAPEAGQAAAPGEQMALPDGRTVHVLPISGTILPKANLMSDMSGGTAMTNFERLFRAAAADEEAAAIVLDIDSPGGVVSGVPEAARMIFEARRDGRPIIAVANHLAASAAYWLAAAADELVVTPSGRVGSIGVLNMHDDLTKALEAAGIKRTMIHAGARKVELYPYAALSDEARAHLEAGVAETYDQFAGDVARFRAVSKSVVKADPEKADQHMGGGRVYGAKQAVALNMADRIATLGEVLAGIGKPQRKSASLALRRRAMSLG